MDAFGQTSPGPEQAPDCTFQIPFLNCELHRHVCPPMDTTLTVPNSFSHGLFFFTLKLVLLSMSAFECTSNVHRHTPGAQNQPSDSSLQFLRHVPRQNTEKKLEHIKCCIILGSTAIFTHYFKFGQPLKQKGPEALTQSSRCLAIIMMNKWDDVIRGSSIVSSYHLG